MYYGLLYAMPIVLSLILMWAFSVVRGDYEVGAAFGLLGALAALVSAVSAQVVMRLVRSASGTSRNRVALMFRPLMTFVQIGAVVVTLGIGTALVAVSFYLPVLLTRHYLPKLTMFIGLAAIYIAYKICKVILSATPNASFSVNGDLVGRNQAPTLWSLVDDLARKLNTPSPERIVFSLDDNICVTEAELRAGGKTYSGRSMILSLPIMKQLSVSQSAGIIAHELAHFSGGDTKYALRFFPIFRGAKESNASINKAFQKFGGLAIAGLPALLLLNRFLESFAEVEAEISRECEKEADTKAANVAGHSAMVEALIVVHGLSSFWRQCERDLFDLLHKNDKATDNMVKFFDAILPESFVKEVAQKIVTKAAPHPFNSHPTLQQRIEYLGETVDILQRSDKFIPKEKNALITSIPSIEDVEKKLTEIENHRNAALSRLVFEAERAQEQAKKAA